MYQECILGILAVLSGRKREYLLFQMSYMFCQRDWYRLGVIQMVRLVEGRKVWSVLSWLLPRQPCMRGRSSRERVDLGLDVSQFQIVRLISYNFKAIRLSFFIFSARFSADSGELPSSLRLYEGLARLLPCNLRLLNIFCESRSP